MQEQALRRAHFGSGLNIGQVVEPVEEGFNGLSHRAYKRGHSIPIGKRISTPLFSGCPNLHVIFSFQGFLPVGIDLRFVAIKPAGAQKRAFAGHLLCCCQIVNIRFGYAQGCRNWQPGCALLCKSMKFYTIIPLISRRIIAFCAQISGNLRISGTAAVSEHNGTGIHHIDPFHLAGRRSLFHPPLRESAKGRCQRSTSSAECLVSRQLWKPF